MLKSGFISLGTWKHVPVRLHWTVPLFAVVLGRFHFVPGFWFGTVLLTLLHELGHAFLVRLFRQRVVSVDLLPAGGLCRWRGEVSRTRRAIIAWGGAWAQGIVLLLTVAAQAIAGPFESGFAQDLCYAWGWMNFWTILLNLMPIPPLDGANAWPLIPMLVERYARRRALRRVKDRRVRQLETMAADLNDDALSPDLQRQLDRLTREVHEKAEVKLR